MTEPLQVCVRMLERFQKIITERPDSGNTCSISENRGDWKQKLIPVGERKRALQLDLYST